MGVRDFLSRILSGREPERRAVGTDSSFIPPPGAEVYPDSMAMDRALRLAPVFAAGRLIASAISMLPLQQYKKVRRDGRDEREQMPLSSLFSQPSRVGTTPDWIFRSATSMVYRGNAVGLVTERNALEFPTFIEWLNPDDVTVQDQLNMGTRGSFTQPIWYWRGIELPRSDLVHIPWFTLPGRIWGLSPIGAYASAVRTSLAAQKFSEDWFRAGGTPPGTFKNVDVEVDEAEARTMKQRLLMALRTHEPLVYGRDWDYNPVAVSFEDAQFVDTMRLGATEIAAVYGIPPEMIGGETGGSYTYSSPEQRQIEFIQFSLMPWLTKLEAAFSALLPKSQYVKFNVDAMIRTDIQTRYNVYEKARVIGTMNRDEIRAKEDQAPLPDGQGQDYTPQGLMAAAAQTGAAEGEDTSPGEPEETAQDVAVRVNAAGTLIRTGFEAKASLDAVGLPPIEYLPVRPVTVQPIAEAEGVGPPPASDGDNQGEEDD